MAFTQRKMAAGDGGKSSNYNNSLKQPAAKVVVVGTKAGDAAGDVAKRAKAQKVAYIGKKKTPDGRFYTEDSYAYAVKNKYIKPF